MQIAEIKQKMQELGISQADLCRDLGFNDGDLSCYLNEKKSLPNSRAKGLYWYFKYKEVERILKNN